MEVQRIWLQTKILNFMFKVEWSLRGHFGGRYHDLELESYKLCSHQSRVRTIERYKLPGIPASCRPSSTAVWPIYESVYPGFCGPRLYHGSGQGLTVKPMSFSVFGRPSSEKPFPFFPFFKLIWIFQKFQKLKIFSSI